MAIMNRQERAKYLLEPYIANLATVDNEGFPLVTPMWYVFEDEAIWMMTGLTSSKVRNIIGNPSIGISFTNETRPYKYVTLQGTAEISREVDVERLTRICVKYDGPDNGLKFAATLLRNEMVIIKITINRILSWSDS